MKDETSPPLPAPFTIGSLQSRTKMGVIDELLDLIGSGEALTDKDQAFQDILAREEQASTGLEKGIAVPHARTTAVKTPVLAIGLSEEGIPFGAMDGLPSRLFFLILTPPDRTNEHLRLLREIAFLTNDSLRRERLMNAKSPEALRGAWDEFLNEKKNFSAG